MRCLREGEATGAEPRFWSHAFSFPRFELLGHKLRQVRNVKLFRRAIGKPDSGPPASRRTASVSERR